MHCFFLTIVSMVMNEQRENLSSLSAENQQLMEQMKLLENKTEELTGDRDNLSWTLNVILNSDIFPVNEYCPDRSKCVCL